MSMDDNYKDNSLLLLISDIDILQPTMVLELLLQTHLTVYRVPPIQEEVEVSLLLILLLVKIQCRLI